MKCEGGIERGAKKKIGPHCVLVCAQRPFCLFFKEGTQSIGIPLVK